VLVNTFDPLWSIQHVLPPGYFPEITDAIIVPHSVNVIDLRRPTTMHKEPCESVGIIPFASNANTDVAFRANTPGNGAYTIVATLDSPLEHASLWIVGKNLLKLRTHG
jgi:hypothetical protein